MMNLQQIFHTIGLIVLTLLSSFPCNAHQGHHHSKKTRGENGMTQSQDMKHITEQINRAYLANIKHIFVKKCMDCHGNNTKYPWYYIIPIFHSVINYDIKKAKEHIDFSTDFPFISHASLEEDLSSITESIQKNEMPPFRYRLFHPTSALTDAEKQKVTQWTSESLKLLKDFNPRK